MTKLTKCEIEARKILVTALRSGNYTQEKFFLETQRGNCCLGVACREYKKLHPEFEVALPEFGMSATRFGKDKSTKTLPPELQTWLGLNNIGTLDRGSLSRLNDAGLSFAQIADIIEETYNATPRKKEVVG